MESDESAALAVSIHHAVAEFITNLIAVLEEFDTTEIDLATKFDYKSERYDLIVKKRDRRGPPGNPLDIGSRETRAAVWVWAYIQTLAKNKGSAHPSDYGVSYDDWLDIRDVLAKVIPDAS